jgi:hypothetical protein
MSYGDVFPGGQADRPVYELWPWCKRCLAGTRSKTCPSCNRPKAACAECGRCPKCDGPIVGKDG